jgi:hypothetical protein
MGLRTINRGALGPRVGARERVARSIAQHKRSENEGGRRNPVKSGASVRSPRAGFASIAPFRARRDRGRLPPTTGPVCQGWAIPSRANRGRAAVLGQKGGRRLNQTYGALRLSWWRSNPNHFCIVGTNLQGRG